MAAQSPSRRPATLEDIKAHLRWKQLLQNGSSKMAKYCGTALNLGFTLWSCKYNRWIFIISITFAFFSPQKKKKRANNLRRRMKKHHSILVLLILLVICMLSPLYGPYYFQPSPRRWTNVQTRKWAGSYSGHKLWNDLRMRTNWKALIKWKKY